MAFSHTYYVKSGTLTYEDFCEAIKKITTATSVTGIVYSSIQVTADSVQGIRESTGAPFSIQLKKLYDAYRYVDVFTTTALKPYVDRVQSPSLAILIACGAISKAGEEQTLKIANEKGISHANGQSKKSVSKPIWKKPFFWMVVLAIALFFICQGNPGNSVDNKGQLNELAHQEAILTIKSQIKNPSSFQDCGWRSVIYDSNSASRRYVMKQDFIQKNEWGDEIRCMGFVYFDVDGHATGVEIMQL